MRTEAKLVTKKYGGLFDKIVSLDNLELAYNKAAKGKRSRGIVSLIGSDLPFFLTHLQQLLITGRFTTADYKIKKIFEPKERLIYILPFYPDRIVHHAIMNVLEPIFEKWFYDHSLACRKGKGIHSGSRMTAGYVKRFTYCIKGDYSKFYPSIDHDVMKSILRHKIKDKRVLALLDDIIDSIPGKTNLPIGNYVSQWLGNLYLQKFDEFCYEQLHVQHYIRYCDDFVIFSNNKAKLSADMSKLISFAAYDLHMHFSKLQLFKVKQGVDFLGYRHFPDKILLRKSTALRFKRRIRHMHRLADLGILDRLYIRGLLASINGWLQHAYTFNFRKYLQLSRLEVFCE